MGGDEECGRIRLEKIQTQKIETFSACEIEVYGDSQGFETYRYDIRADGYELE